MASPALSIALEKKIQGGETVESCGIFREKDIETREEKSENCICVLD